MRPPPRLVALSAGERDASDAPRLLAAVAAAARAGLEGVLLREPRWEDGPLFAAARALRALLPGGWLAVHDRPHVALAAGADAVHLGFRSLPAGLVRERLGGPGAPAIGRSTHAGDGPASWHGADYLFLGPVRDTPSKRGWREPIGLDGLREGIARARLPVLAIGGLRPEDARGVLQAGAHGLAVRAGILQAADPAAACRAYRDALG